MRISLALLIISRSAAFAPSGNKIIPSPILSETTSCLAATNNDMPTPLATDGDWSAYLDEETTGYGALCDF